ncbi:M4 family metallopeptidase [Streptomyces sp. Je 1-4]|uniref:M4 family metallopeptidase n=1 Tax=Streptomyces TaxID=1883 RepID=UPI0021D8B313|nr:MULTISPECIES: M4 family metallopeptidase [unclassified Streptomyces]UYB39855.1 M4 family metallopeptidase [Streptomyces sp. Je 1-4]UZQ35915.1 M4 family metallopeptidase [Streptomyces sp. Je 1-4] [Streptomyces sp. Je 1-4 4N24]UZQ43333.1 M4 family metallopeptidase [Streptomyces sp. Je 1-4] [Streptomyces sp. Je 1-4 4N24_ara]
MTPRISRKTRVAGTAIAAAALLAAGITAGTAGASPASAPTPDGSPLKLSASHRAELLRDASATKAQTAKELGLGAQEKLVVKDVIKDADGTTHTRYDRTYAGLPVLGGDMIVHTAKGGAIKDTTKSTEKSVKVASTTAKIAPTAAAKSAQGTAVKSLSAKKADAQTPKKVVWAASGTPVLAYDTVVKGVKKDGTPSRMHVITDANSGKKLFQYDEIRTGKGESEYSGSVELGTSKEGNGFTLTDKERGGHKTTNLENGESGDGKPFTDEDDKWGTGKPDDPQTAAVDAHYGAGVTWDYYKKVHGRDGIKGDGKGAFSRVHYGKSYVNAFWDDDCFCMTYGDGEGDKAPLTALDVAAHEMSHGVTSATANLTYSGESGGLNEGTSDIFGTSAEFYAKSEKDPGDYLIGEKIDINGDGTPLRYMDKPSKDGQSQDNWDSSTGGLDPHYSSGVANHFFYLLSEGSGPKEIGGVKYDSPTADGKKVEGIGRDKAEKIWFKALTEYMTSNTDYKAAREATVKAATDLYKAGSAEVKGVEAAWTGVAVK